MKETKGNPCVIQNHRTRVGIVLARSIVGRNDCGSRGRSRTMRSVVECQRACSSNELNLTSDFPTTKPSECSTILMRAEREPNIITSLYWVRGLMFLAEKLSPGAQILGCSPDAPSSAPASNVELDEPALGVKCTDDEANCRYCSSTGVLKSICTTLQYCSGGTCVAKKANGSSCSSGTYCTSGYCVDGNCCNTSSCPGGCNSCNSGACAVQPAGSAPGSDCALSKSGPCGAVCNGGSECAVPRVRAPAAARRVSASAPRRPATRGSPVRARATEPAAAKRRRRAAPTAATTPVRLAVSRPARRARSASTARTARAGRVSTRSARASSVPPPTRARPPPERARPPPTASSVAASRRARRRRRAASTAPSASARRRSVARVPRTISASPGCVSAPSA